MILQSTPEVRCVDFHRPGDFIDFVKKCRVFIVEMQHHRSHVLPSTIILITKGVVWLCIGVQNLPGNDRG